MTIAPHLFVIHHAKHAQPPKRAGKRYAKVHFIGDIFKPHRTYEYRLPEGEVILSGMHVIVPVGPNAEEMTAVVVSRHSVRRYWFGKTKTILRRAPNRG